MNNPKRKHLGLIKNKAINGVFLLSIRRLIVQALQTLANIFLARLLFPSDFGLFAIIIIYLTFFTHITDIGFSASLIQNKKVPSREELRGMFTIHLILGLLALPLMIILAPVFYKIFERQLGFVGLKLILACSVIPFFYNLRLIPQGLMERDMDYKKLMIGEIFELALQQIIAVSFAFKGFGAGSLVYGLIISRLLGSLMFFVLNPWNLGLSLSFNKIKKHFIFGYHYQLSSLVGMISGSLAPFVVGGMVGTGALGLISWAGGVASLPRALGEVICRVIFPLGARVQNDKKFMGKTISKLLELISFVTFPASALIVSLASPITYLIFTSKWENGIGALYIFGLNSALLLLSMLFINSLLALGESKLVRDINIFWVILEWTLAIPLVKIFGFIGFPIGELIVGLTFFIPLMELKKRVKVEFLSAVVPYFIFATISGILTFVYSHSFPIRSVIELATAAMFGMLTYLTTLIIFKRGRVVGLIASIINNLSEFQNTANVGTLRTILNVLKIQFVKKV